MDNHPFPSAKAQGSLESCLLFPLHLLVFQQETLMCPDHIRIPLTNGDD